MALLTLALPEAADILVRPGDKVSISSTLAKGRQPTSEQSIKIASLLGVPAKQIARFLTRSIGSQISSGEIIARRQGFFTEIIVRSPFDATLAWLDLTKGEVFFRQKGPSMVVKSPVPGRIKKVTKERLEVEFSGEMIEAVVGNGWAQGEFFLIDQGFFNIDYRVQGKIIAISAISLLTLAKLRALEVAGVVVILSDEADDTLDWLKSAKLSKTIPFLAVGGRKAKKFSHFDGKPAVLNGQDKYLIIIE